MAEPLALDAKTPFGVTARELVAMVEGTHTDSWPAASGLGSAELQVKASGGLALQRRWAPRSVRYDRDMDGVEDGLYRVAIPVDLQLTTAEGTLVVHEKVTIIAGTARSAGSELWMTFSALQPPFDSARIREPDSASCDMARLRVQWLDSQFAGLELFTTQSSGGFCGVAIKSAAYR